MNKSTFIGVFIFLLLYIPLISNALADEYQCSAMWSVGTYSGKGDSIGDAIDDARETCDEAQELGEHECGASPVTVNCVDQGGRCLNSAAFLEHGYMGGDKCN